MPFFSGCPNLLAMPFFSGCPKLLPAGHAVL
jgi:hypothetical protein